MLFLNLITTSVSSASSSRQQRALQFVLDNLLGVLLDKMQEKLNDMMRRDDELERMRR